MVGQELNDPMARVSLTDVRRKHVVVIIPAYNEGPVIGEVLDDLQKAGYHNLIVIDDASKDNTAGIAKAHHATVLRHCINRGQGAALKTGIDYALREGAEIIVTFDADGQHIPEEIQKLLTPIEQGKTQVTLGSRFLQKNETIPIIRKLFLKGGAIIIRLFYGIKLTDSHNGFRAFSRRAAQAIEITTDRMEHASEILEQISKKKIAYQEVPVTIRYTEYSKKKGQSTLNAFNILLKMIKGKVLR